MFELFLFWGEFSLPIVFGRPHSRSVNPRMLEQPFAESVCMSLSVVLILSLSLSLLLGTSPLIVLDAPLHGRQPPRALAQVLRRVGGLIEGSLASKHALFSPIFEPSADAGRGVADWAYYPAYHPDSWRQTERELCRYTAASKRAFQELLCIRLLFSGCVLSRFTASSLLA